MPNIFTEFQNPRRSSPWEIFDEKKFLQTHKHRFWKDKNYIPPIYFVYRGYKYVPLGSLKYHAQDYLGDTQPNHIPTYNRPFVALSTKHAAAPFLITGIISSRNWAHELLRPKQILTWASKLL